MRRPKSYWEEIGRGGMVKEGVGGWIVQVSNPACPKDTTRICRRQGRGNPPPTLIERRGNPPLVAKTRCDQILLFSDCQKDGFNAPFAIPNKKGRTYATILGSPVAAQMRPKATKESAYPLRLASKRGLTC